MALKSFKGDLKIQVENAKTKYEEEKRETQDLKNQIKKLEAKIRDRKQIKVIISLWMIFPDLETTIKRQNNGTF